ncbi:MAG: AbrB/MazE/SpoVT family DNA-binding domain-containing protein [Bdellovibrionales bacterium]|nr:AbrB/MazE/SpoVT family DNA-binding domain-containing protein [Ramlibacter sp.]
MKITSKGQVTIPQSVREQAGLHPHSEVEFEVQPTGDVLLRYRIYFPTLTIVSP